MTAAIVLEEKSPYGPGTNDKGPDDVQGKKQIVDYLERSLGPCSQGDDVTDRKESS